MRGAKKRNDVKISVFSNIKITFIFKDSDSNNYKILGCAIILVFIDKLLAMSFSDVNTLMQYISSLLSALSC